MTPVTYFGHRHHSKEYVNLSTFDSVDTGNLYLTFTFKDKVNNMPSKATDS
jgi:hypothetical protein